MATEELFFGDTGRRSGGGPKTRTPHVRLTSYLMSWGAWSEIESDGEPRAYTWGLNTNRPFDPIMSRCVRTRDCARSSHGSTCGCQ
jgi:hypothetical protein